MKRIVLVLFGFLLMQCGVIENVLDCDEYEVGFTLVNNTNKEEIDVKISVVKIYSDSLEILETETHKILKSKKTKVASSAKWSEKISDYYRDINFYEGIYTSYNTDFCLLIEEGGRKYFTYSAGYDGEGYCDSCGKACVDVEEGYDSSIVYFLNEKITSNVLKNINSYYEYPFKNNENIE